MIGRAIVASVVVPFSALMVLQTSVAIGADGHKALTPQFQTSDRCIACHNGLLTPSGEDMSIGFDWRASMMANSSRDPYWQASVRRESIDHPESKAIVEDTCSICHMPITRYEAKLRGQRGQIFSHLPFEADKNEGRQAQDGVSCSICHQMSRERLGTAESFTGGFVIEQPSGAGERPEYGPFQIEAGQARIMRSSTEGFKPTQSDHIRQSEMCATCHTLITETLGPQGNVIGRFPEQVPYQEWLHSDYKDKQSCQACHMPAVSEDVPITRVLGVPRQGVSRHQFVAANFFMLRMLNRYRDELSVAALSQELTAASERTLRFLESQAARVSIEHAQVAAGRLQADIVVENLGGHKLPTAYPSRRAWLHLVVRDRSHRQIFESGALNADGSIQGNDNDADPAKFEAHYTEIRASDQVQIYESILGDSTGAVTTALLSTERYLKDNRLLPHGFDKRTAEPDVAVHGAAAEDPNFTDKGDRLRYSVPLTNSEGPFEVEVELLYQPIGFRWATNLRAYASAAETHRFTMYYDSMGSATTAMLAHASTVVDGR
jgi:hypothetical protein